MARAKPVGYTIKGSNANLMRSMSRAERNACDILVEAIADEEKAHKEMLESIADTLSCEIIRR